MNKQLICGYVMEAIIGFLSGIKKGLSFFTQPREFIFLISEAKPSVLLAGLRAARVAAFFW
ncbi:hypothetical protein [Chitinophaga jiangningensis]|uniref:hypothetical protein n=1 Tax=Chitinophaga jiangningensis TaxID=1419482 RepID=UPI0009342964|nr:hypothetical protein [Chitinophaga jiangningensis]